MLTPTKYNSVCFSPHEAPRSPPTTLLLRVAAHAGRGHRQQRGRVCDGRTPSQVNSLKTLSQDPSQSKVGPETI